MTFILWGSRAFIVVVNRNLATLHEGQKSPNSTAFPGQFLLAVMIFTFDSIKKKP